MGFARDRFRQPLMGTLPVVPHTRFNRSSLVQLLSASATAGGAGAAGSASALPSLPEVLSQWLGWAAAIDLSSALGADAPGSAGGPTDKAADVRACARACQQVRALLTETINGDVQALEDNADDGLRRSVHLSLQRTMETRLTSVRARLRAALAGQSPEMARLAALDAALEQALAGRERQLLAAVPGMLAQQHSAQVAKAVAKAAANVAADRAAGARTSGSPNEHLRAVLLAELETRLQPIEGLLAALTVAQPAAEN